MAEPIYDLYLYLARRDKSAIRILTIFRSKKQSPNRLDSLAPLNLPNNLMLQLEKIIYTDRLLWEPWIETFENFDDFRKTLRKRGYLNIPISNRPEYPSPLGSKSVINTSNLPQKKIMISKKN
jgi:hypothetical protein